MMPAIRQAIADALRSMVQSLNQTIEHSLSVQSLRWRLESLRTDKPVAEIVLLHTLSYRVEQVFLIHSQSDLLLAHVAVQDHPLVSGHAVGDSEFRAGFFRDHRRPGPEYLASRGSHCLG